MNDSVRELRGQAAPCAGVLLAGWPVLRWFVARLGDGGDERFGLVALALALILTPRAVWRERIAAWRLIVAGVFALAVAFPVSGTPMLLRALLLVCALSVLFCRGGGALGRAGLLALSLPVTATLQFFAGYPLRVLTAELGRPLIALFGVATERSGVALEWAGGVVVVDAPCSGVHMLWTGGVLVCAVAAWLRLGAGRAFFFGVAGLCAILLGNTVRAAVLFFIESGLWRAPGWAHEGVGLAIFAALATGLLWLGFGLKGANREGGAKPPAEPKLDAPFERVRLNRRLRPTVVFVFAVMCSGAAVMPLAGQRGTVSTASDADFPGWPELFEGKPWIRLRNPRDAAAFASGFAGKTGVFKQTGADGAGRIVVLRWIREASRGVHPAADCFRASGFAIKPGGLVRDANDVMWSEFFATKDGETWRVRERWRDDAGGAWTDVSAWYWAAVRGRGPWWAVTVAVACGD
ncbi:exosortase/archaeosortase family protein [Ereboglobus sp. PH5-10]|uniref:archaeosortase/exosortase family protein n=1 Tax=Ereboglobus sp. PH5-10 TaxID=2940629 RepID=UPI0024072519|nr:archaeosortase/exosortase family protein [Ereboglobus sp. PH5-10]MDF9826162.1 exosortase/archaeosortase family protein [Ereboglobus sp. PH5-10]